MAGSWPPEGLVGPSTTVTVRLGMFGPQRYRCPASDALKARGLHPSDQPARKPEVLEMFLNGPFMVAADSIDRPDDDEAPSSSRVGRQRPLHDGVRQWTEHAVRVYRDAFPVDPDLRPARSPWTYRHLTSDGGRTLTYRITAWGRCLESKDGRRRELRLPVKRLRERSAAERAVAALVAAEGDCDPRVERIKVIQFSLSDGSAGVLFDGSRQEALAVYRADGASAVRALLSSREFRPGSACVSCAIAPVCPALPRAEGLLGITDRSRPRRSWSSTTARGHQSCPARGYLRSLRLPTEESVERGAAVERGRAVHAFLADRHAQRPATPCTTEIPESWVPDGYRLPEEERRLGAHLLRHHAEVCPLRISGETPEVRSEPRLVFEDTAADLVVLAEPDLLYQDAGSWVWRETKTSARDRPPRNLLATYPQLALAVRIMGSGLLAGTHERGRVELELLRPAGVDLHTLDPLAPQTQASAEAVLRDQVAGWHAETLFEAVPGPGCSTCEVARWCSARPPRQDASEAVG